MRHAMIWTLATMFAIAVRAEFNVPKSVHRMGDMATAQAEARAQCKPVTFLYSDEKSTCPLCCGVSTEVINDLKQKSVMIYVDAAKGDWKDLPRPVQQALNSPEAGKFIPKTVVMDAEAAHVIAVVPYTRDARALEKSLKDAKKKIEAVVGKPRRGPMPLPAAQTGTR